MEDPDLSEKHHGDPASLSLTDVRPKLNEKRLNITPLDIGPYWMGKMACRVLWCFLLM